MSQKKWLGLLLLCGFLAFANNLLNPFIYDDLEYVAPGPGLSSWAEVAKIFAPEQSRHFLQFTFQACYQFQKTFGLTRPVVYHLFNNLLHLACGLLVFFLAARFFAKFANPPLMAFLSALFFLIHPLQVESVTYISGRSSVLCTLLILLSIWFFWNFVERKKVSAILICIFFAGLAAETKELAMVLPFYFVLIVVFALQHHASAFNREFWLKFFSWTFLICLIAAGFIFVWRRDDFIYLASLRPITQAWMSESVIFFKFMGLTLFPYPLALDRDEALIQSALNPWFLGAVVLWAALIAFFWRRLQRRPLPEMDAMMAMAFAWFFIGLMPVLLFPPDDLMSERWVYLSLAGAGMGFALFFEKSVAWFGRFHRRVFVGIFLGFMLLTWQRNWVFGNEVRIWQDTVAKSPRKARAFYSLGQAYFKLEKWPEAIAAYETALSLKPNYLPPRLYLGWAFEKTQEKDKAYEAYKTLLQFNIHRSQARYYYLKALERFIYLGIEKRDFATLEETITLALRSIPPSAELWHNLGKVRLERGLYPQAKDAFRMAADISPKGLPWNLALADLYLREKNFAKSEAILQGLARNFPNHPDVVFETALLFDEQGPALAAQTESTFEQFLRLEPYGPRAQLAKRELARIRARLTKALKHR